MIKVRRDDILKVSCDAIVMPKFYSPKFITGVLNIVTMEGQPFKYSIEQDIPFITNKDEAEILLADYYSNIVKTAKAYELKDIAIPFFWKNSNLTLEEFADITCSILKNYGEMEDMTFTIVSKNVEDFHKLREIYHKYIDQDNNKNNKEERPFYFVFKNQPNLNHGVLPYKTRTCIQRHEISYELLNPESHERLYYVLKVFDENYLKPLFDEIIEYVNDSLKDKDKQDDSGTCEIQIGNEKYKVRKYKFNCSLDSLNEHLYNATRRLVAVAQVSSRTPNIYAMQHNYKTVQMRYCYPLGIWFNPNPEMGTGFECIVASESNVGGIRLAYPKLDRNSITQAYEEVEHIFDRPLSAIIENCKRTNNFEFKHNDETFIIFETYLNRYLVLKKDFFERFEKHFIGYSNKDIFLKVIETLSLYTNMPYKEFIKYEGAVSKWTNITL